MSPGFAEAWVHSTRRRGVQPSWRQSSVQRQGGEQDPGQDVRFGSLNLAYRGAMRRRRTLPCRSETTCGRRFGTRRRGRHSDLVGRPQ